MIRAGQTVQLNASIPENLMKELKVIAKKEKRSISNLISLLLEKEVERIKIRK